MISPTVDISVIVIATYTLKLEIIGLVVKINWRLPFSNSPSSSDPRNIESEYNF